MTDEELLERSFNTLSPKEQWAYLLAADRRTLRELWKHRHDGKWGPYGGPRVVRSLLRRAVVRYRHLFARVR